LLLLLTANSEKTVTVRYTETAPKIDGYIEEIWNSADSASDFIQNMPYEKEKPTDATLVYLLHDKNNLYVAFRCSTKNAPPVCQLSGISDYAVIYIDPFGSKTNAYYFVVTTSGNYDDGMVLDDGAWTDDSWDAVWYKAVKIYPDHYEIEMKIPFKSIRYKKGLSEWGVNFKRYITGKQERDYWTEVLQKDGNKVSNFGKLLGVNPQTKGYYFEVYPEGFVRYDKYEGEAARYKPRASMNVKWDITSQTTINATALPDFAQIESDPFSFNLSQYPTYLTERRPFFVEGQDVFQFNNAMTFSPLEIFYTRAIGKSVENEPVSILGGLKLTHKSENWNIGLLGAYTDTLATEPKKAFSVLRIKKSVFENSDLGILFSGMRANEHNYNYALSFDGDYRSANNQFSLQTAMSERNKKYGGALSSGYYGLIKDIWAISSSVEIVNDSFDVSEIGYVPWKGLNRYFFSTGLIKRFPKGQVRVLSITPGFSIIKEPFESQFSQNGILNVSCVFRTNWSFYSGINYGKHYEMQQSYIYRDLYANASYNDVKYECNLGFDYYYNFNYQQGYPAYAGDNWLSLDYIIHPKVHLELTAEVWPEWDAMNLIRNATSLITPRIDYIINKSISLDIFSEFVTASEQAKINKTNLIENRIGFLFSWNFSPKSWLYIAFNDYREQNDQGRLVNISRIGAIKAKYLIYF